MARASTRQKFVTGQVVWIHAYHAYWRKAEVIEADVVRKAARYSAAPEREVHYVKVIYFDRDDKKQTDNPWEILNNRSKISDDAAHDLVLKGKEIANKQADVRQHETWERTHAEYVAQAEHVIELVELLSAAPDQRPENVALYLRSTFSLKDKRTRERVTVEDIRTQRRELSYKATEARGLLQELDVKEWS